VVKELINRVLAPGGLRIVSREWFDELRSRAHADIQRDDTFMAIYDQCRPYTMTCIERMYGLYASVRYLVEGEIPGDFVECGVWRGGSAMVCALTLAALGDTSRRIYLYDTFDGMTAPTERDIDVHGRTVAETLDRRGLDDVRDFCRASREDATRNMHSTGYPPEQLRFVQGDVLATIPRDAPDAVALLRLDTDWYESTYHELTHLFPLLTRRGVLLVDDYGHWRGAQEAVDRYFTEHEVKMVLARLDYSCRMGIKI